MSISILVPDSLHINKRNFSSFFSWIEKNKINIHFENNNKDWISLYGVYDSKLDILYEKIDLLTKIEEEELFAFCVYDLNIFNICRAELLSLVATRPEWYNEDYPNNLREIYKKLYTNNRSELLQNMAAAWYWVDFWKKRLSELKQFSHCCVFSGGLIYQKSLIELLKYTPTKVMVMESLFTGNEYYCEERYSSIANNSDIKHLAIFNSYKKTFSSKSEYDKERMKAINKFLLMKNKNVQQPTDSEILVFKQQKPIITIIGQVINDFSVLEYKGRGLSTIKIYKELISKLSENGFNVVLKTHPWEEKKNNIRTSLTKNIIEEFLKNLTENQQECIKIVDHYSIKKLFKQSDFIISLNSQGLLEAAFDGIKPIQLGNAFYGKKGFTYDYDFLDIDQLVNDLVVNKLTPTLSLEEFDLFEEFITILLQKHAVSIHASGVSVLSRKFNLPTIIPLVENVPKEKSKTTLPTQKDVVKKENTTIVNMVELPKVVLQSDKNRKYQKFRNNPRQFFADSRNPVIRSLMYFFPYK